MQNVERPTTIISYNRNLSFAERALSVVFGLGLAAVAARPRPNMALSALALAAGSYLAWRGATGRDPVKAVLFEDGA